MNVRGTLGGAERKQRITSSGMGHDDIRERQVVTNWVTAREEVDLTCRVDLMANTRLLQVQGTEDTVAVTFIIAFYVQLYVSNIELRYTFKP